MALFLLRGLMDDPVGESVDSLLEYILVNEVRTKLIENLS